MQEAGGEGSAAELARRLERLQTELDAQRNEINAMRAELWRLQHDDSPASPMARQPLSPSLPLPAKLEAIPPLPPTSQAETAPPVTIADLRRQPPIASANMFQQATASEAKGEVHRSLENRIGSQFFSRIGIVTVLIGVALFLKLAYDKHWIHSTPTGRIVAGLLVGAVVVLWSERFRRKGFDAFSYSLKAIGTGTLYLSLWASFQMYHLFPASVALIAMIAVTAWNAAMAWIQDSELLAAYALVGGFLTPALLGSGGNHETFLFSYILAMDVAVLFLLYKKPWQRLLFGSFPGTVAYFIGWYVKFFTADQAGVTALFVLLLAVPFVAVALAGRQRELVSEGVLTPLAAASFLAVALYSVLQDSGRHAWLPWGAVVLAAIYLLLMRVRKAGIAEAIHLALAVIFLTIAIPLKAEGRWITVGWLTEGVALLWTAAKLFGPEVQSRVRSLMRWLGCAALSLGVIQSLIFWFSESSSTAFWNARFATELSAVAALSLASWLARNPRNVEESKSLISWPALAAISTTAAHLVAALAGSREIVSFFENNSSAVLAYRDQLEPVAVGAFLTVYSACITVWVLKRPATVVSPFLRWIGFVYLGLGYMAIIVTPIVDSGGPSNIIWNARFLFELSGGVALAVTAWLYRRSSNINDVNRKLIAAICFVSFNLLALLTGVHEIFTYFGLSATGDASLAQAFTISAWLMLYAAGLLTAGFVRRTAFVRWQGLGLLVFTIGKVFLYDMRNLSSVYRVLSFIVLGVLLMAVSFAYQKDWLKLRDADPDASTSNETLP